MNRDTAGSRQRMEQMCIYAKLADGQWHRVVRQDRDGCSVTRRGLPFEAIWSPTPPLGDSEADTLRVSWRDLDSPLPAADIPCWAYALTYPDHRRETLDGPSFNFFKGGTVSGAGGDIAYRECLDYEGEIAVLLHRDHPELYGFLMGNDLTDRGIQVREFDPGRQAEVFAKAKQFDGALRVGPLIAIGNETAWQPLQLHVLHNGAPRQEVRARDCRIDPRFIARDLDAELSRHRLVLAMTGTSGGTLFRSPGRWERLKLWVCNGFSVRRGKEAWLKRLQFLRPGDEIVMRSPMLGESTLRVYTRPM